MRLGFEARAGLHAGEVAFEDADVSGIAVAIGAGVGVGTLAGPLVVLLSRWARDLVAGSGLTFEHACEFAPKGVPIVVVSAVQ